MMPKPTIRCSSLPQLLACPGSRTLSALVNPPKGDGTAVTWEGNWGHFNVAYRLMKEQSAFGPDGGELPLPKCPGDYRPSPFAQWMSKFCFDSIIDGLDNTWALIVEQNFEYEFERFTLTGHPDVVALKMEKVDGEAEPQVVEAILWDEKYGAIPVEPADVNEQVHGYFTLMVCEYRYLRKLTCRILQPRNDEESGIERITKVTVEGRGELVKIADALKKKVHAALDNPFAVNSDGPQCKYCAARLQCPAIRGDIEQMKLILTPEMIEVIKPNCPIDDLVALNDDRRKLVPVLEDAQLALKAAVAAAPGGELGLPDGRVARVKPRKGKRTVEDVAAAATVLTERFNLNDKQYFQCFELKPGATEHVLAEANNCPVKGNKPLTGEKLYAEHLGHLTEQAESLVLTVG